MTKVRATILLSGLLVAQQSPSWGRATVDSASSRVPTYIISAVSGSNARVPYVAYLKLQGLEPSKTYRYVVRADNSTAPATNLNVNLGAGNPIYYDAGTNSFVRTTSPSLSLAGGYGTLTTNTLGEAAFYFILEPTANSRFTTGNTVYAKVFLLEDNGTDSAVVIADKFPITTLTFASSCSNQDTCGSFLYDSITPGRVPSRFVFLYDEYLLGPNPNYKRPISGAIVEQTGISYPTNYLITYRTQVAPFPGRWGTIIPNNLPNGIRSIIYGPTLPTPSYLDTVGIYDRDGNWPSGINTVNPNNGPLAVGLLGSLSYPLKPRPSGVRAPDGWNPQYGAFVWRNLSTNPLCTGCDGLYYVSSDRIPLSATPNPCIYSLPPQFPVDSQAIPLYFQVVGGPGWGDPMGGADSLLIEADILLSPYPGYVTGIGGACEDPSNPGNCLPCEVPCDMVFDPSSNWLWVTTVWAFANEAGHLVRNYTYSSPGIYDYTPTGPLSQMGTPLGLQEYSGAPLSNLDVNIYPQLIISAELPYEEVIFPVYPFMFLGYQATLEWELLDASNNILDQGTVSGVISLGSPSVTFQDLVSVYSLSLGTYQITGRLMVQGCRNIAGGPIPLTPITFTVTRTTGISSTTIAPVRLYTHPDRWIVEGLNGNCPAVLYDVRGQLVWQGTVNPSGQLTIPREGLQVGLYVLSVEGKTWRLAHMP